MRHSVLYARSVRPLKEEIMRILNLILCFTFFFLTFYLFGPEGFSQENQANPSVSTQANEDDNEDLDRKIQEAVQEALEKFKNQELPQIIKDSPQFKAAVDEKVDVRLYERKKAQDAQREEWLQKNPDLKGRLAVAPHGNSTEGAWGVKFDLGPGQSAKTEGGAEKVNIYYARITPFVRLQEWGVEMSLNLRKFLKEEIIQGELREEVSDQQLETAEVYYRKIFDKVEVIVRLGQMKEAFVRSVFDQAVFSTKNILDKYSLNESKALRVDIGFGEEDAAHKPGAIKERQVWVSATGFNMDGNEDTFDDFAVRVVASLSILNRFTNWNLKPIEVWGGAARIDSGTAPIGEQDKFVDPSRRSEMAVFGFKINLQELTGQQLGEVFGEFVRRVQSGDLTDQSWVIGWVAKLKPSKEGERPWEVAARLQSQQDDLNPEVEDGTAFSGGVLIPLSGYNLALRLNASYIFDSTDQEDREGAFIFSYDFEVLF